MNEKRTRIEVSLQLHQTLKNLYADLKSKGEKGLTLIKVLDDLCKAGLAYQNIPKENLPPDSHEQMNINTSINHQQDAILVSITEMKSLHEAFREREADILQREMQLLKREEIVNSRLNKDIELKPTADKNIMEDIFAVDRQSALEKKINDMDQIIRDLKKENNKLLNELHSMISKIEINTRKDVLMDEILPILTPVIIGFKHFQDENDKKQNSDPKIVELLKLFVQLNSFQQSKLINDLKKEVQKPKFKFKKPE